MESVKIGASLQLDTRTRVLFRVRDGRKIKLGVSTCECLNGLLHAKGEILSQEALIDLGWRQVGLEVTSSSLRVAINQIRRAIMSLQADKEILIVTVPRAGYRLIIQSENNEVNLPRKTIPDESFQPEPVVSGAVEIATIVPPSLPEAARNSATKRLNRNRLAMFVFPLLSCLSGVLVSFMINKKIEDTAVSVNYAAYKHSVPELPDGVKIFVDNPQSATPDAINKTLALWLTQPGAEKDFSYLYLNMNPNKNYSGLFACKKPIGDDNSDCSSFIFSTF